MDLFRPMFRTCGAAAATALFGFTPVVGAQVPAAQVPAPPDAAGAARVAPVMGARDAAGRPLTGKVLIKLARDVAAPIAAGPDGMPRFGLPTLDRTLSELGATRVKPVFVRPPRGRRNETAAAALGLDRWYRVEFGGEMDSADHAAAVARLAELADVDRAEADRVVLPAVVPNDPDYVGSQWPLQPAKIDAEGAWDQVTDASALIVAVIDTGVQPTHPDITANLWVNPGEIAGNSIDDEGNGFVDDVHGYNFHLDNADVWDNWPHGMHVNGIIGAVGDNATQVAGVAWQAQLMQGKMFDAGSGSWEAGAAATVYATDNGATITNNSWGDTVAGPQVFDDARDYATANDVLQVAAAGNQGDTNHFWPAVYDDFLSVASTNSGDGLSWFSSHGDWIDMSAPGEGIWNLWVNGGAASLSGTSMASPHVAGAAALVRTVNPQLDALETRLALRLNGDDLGNPGFDNDYGHGRLDVAKAVAAASSISLSKQSAGRPDSVDIHLHAPSEAGMYHVVLAGISGNEPGIELADYDPADTRLFPVNEDFLLGLIASDPFFPLLPNWFDLLDANGHAMLTFSVLKGKFFKDQRVSIAFCTLDPADLSQIRFVSAAVHFDVQ